MKMSLARATVSGLLFLLGACNACGTVEVPNPESPHQPTASDAITRSLQASIALYRKGSVVCSGERVDSRHILTAYHCAAAAVLSNDELEEKEIFCGLLGTTFEQCVSESRVLNHVATYATYNDWLDTPHPTTRIGSWVKLDRKHDLALMLTDYTETQPSVHASGEFPVVGEQVYAIGNPNGMTFSYMGGWVSAINRTDSDLPPVPWLQVDMTILGGASGGGLYTMSGDLIGVVSRSNDVQSFFVPPDVVARFVRLESK